MGETAFEDLCGIRHGTISGIGSQGPTTSILTRIAIKCEDLNLNWLIRGEGEMLLSSEETSSATHVMHTTNGTMNGDVNVEALSQLNDIVSDLRADKERLIREKEEIWELYKSVVKK